MEHPCPLTSVNNLLCPQIVGCSIDGRRLIQAISSGHWHLWMWAMHILQPLSVGLAPCHSQRICAQDTKPWANQCGIFHLGVWNQLKTAAGAVAQGVAQVPAQWLSSPPRHLGKWWQTIGHDKPYPWASGMRRVSWKTKWHPVNWKSPMPGPGEKAIFGQSLGCTGICQ